MTPAKHKAILRDRLKILRAKKLTCMEMQTTIDTKIKNLEARIQKTLGELGQKKITQFEEPESVEPKPLLPRYVFDALNRKTSMRAAINAKKRGRKK